MKTQVVLGTFFGDEGKGSTVQWLCQQAIGRGERPLVIRYSGGPQAGHRVMKDNVEHVCSSFGSGVLLGVPTFLGPEMMVDPISMRLEYEVLSAKGVSPLLFISPRCRVITPYDVLANVNDNKVLGDGSCGKGIFHTFSRYSHDNSQPRLHSLISHPYDYLSGVRDYWEAERIEEYEEMFADAVKWLGTFAKVEELACPSHDYDVLIMEGSQGLLLDMDGGFMPHCTPSRVGLNGVATHFDISEAEVFLVMRPYLTRHGNGYEPDGGKTAEAYFTFEEPTNTDDGYQGVFKRGLFDNRLLTRISDRHRLDNFQKQYHLKCHIVVTHLDCLIHDDMLPHITSHGSEAIDTLQVFFHEAVESLGIVIDNFYGSYGASLSAGQFKEVMGR